MGNCYLILVTKTVPPISNSCPVLLCTKFHVVYHQNCQYDHIPFKKLTYKLINSAVSLMEFGQIIRCETSRISQHRGTEGFNNNNNFYFVNKVA